MGRSGGNIVLFIAGFICLLWTILLAMPTGWQRKSTLIWNFDVGLYHVEVSKSLGGHLMHGVGFLSDKAVGGARGKKTTGARDTIAAITQGTESLRYYRDMFCTMSMVPIVQTSCAPWDQLMIGSWIMMITGFLTVIMFVVGIVFYYWYWHHEAKTMNRKWALGMFISAPCFSMMGLAGYTGLTIQFESWLSEYLLSSRSSTFSYIYVASTVVWFLSWLPALLMCTCGGISDEEDVLDELEWERKQIAEGNEDMYAEPVDYDADGNAVYAAGYQGPADPSQQQQGYDSYGNPVPADPYQQQQGSQQQDQYPAPQPGYQQQQQDPYQQQQQQDPYQQQQHDPYNQPHDPYSQPQHQSTPHQQGY